MCPSKLQTKIIARACSCIFIKFLNKIYPRPGLESSPDAAVQCYVLADNQRITVHWRHSVSWSTKGTNSIRSFWGRSTSSRAVLSLCASFDNTLNSRQIHYVARSYNIPCRWKKRSFGQQILVSEQYLSPEGAELRPAISREWTFQRQHVQ